MYRDERDYTIAGIYSRDVGGRRGEEVGNVADGRAEFGMDQLDMDRDMRKLRW